MPPAAPFSANGFLYVDERVARALAALRLDPVGDVADDFLGDVPG